MGNLELLALCKLDQERRGNRPRSIRKRQDVLKMFNRWLGEAPILAATRQQIEEFLDLRMIGPTTRYHYLSHLHCFYRWAMREGLVETDPTAQIIRPKIRRGLPRPAVTAELAAAIEVADPLMRCWIALAAYQGFRCQDIAMLRREDVLEVDGLLRVSEEMGKGGTEAMLPLHPVTLETLVALPMPRMGWVFGRFHGGRKPAEYLSRDFNKGLRDLGVNATAHQLRHWFGTNLYQQTRDLRLTQELLRHASPATTAIYTAISPEMARTAIGGLRIGGLPRDAA